MDRILINDFGVNQTCLLRRRQLIPVLEWESFMK